MLLLEATLSDGLVWLVIVAAINFALALYYYHLMPIVEMYLKTPETALSLPNRPGYIASLSISVLGTLLIGIFPSLALDVTQYLAKLLGSN